MANQAYTVISAIYLCPTGQCSIQNTKVAREKKKTRRRKGTTNIGLYDDAILYEYTAILGL